MLNRRSDLNLPAAISQFQIVLILLTGFSTVSSAQEATQTFKSSAHRYSIQLPADWHSITAEEIRGITASLPQQAAKYASNWEAVYQESSLTTEGHFIYPYVICQVLPYEDGRTPGNAEITAQINSMNAANVPGQPKTGDNALDQFFAGTTADRPRYDAATHTIFQSMNSDATKWIIVTHFGKDGEVDIICYDAIDTFSSHRAVFEQIQSSFVFDPGAAYPANVALPLGTPPEPRSPSAPQERTPTRLPLIGLVFMWVFEKFGWVGVVIVAGIFIWSPWSDHKSS